MPREVYLKGKAITLDPKRIIGSGGEADIFNIGGGYALKIFKPPTHPDYQGLPLEQQGAKERIATHQRKLRDFPKNLPSKVVTPIDLATDSSSRNILGYEMKLISNSEVLMRYSERSFRAAIPNQDVNTIFRGLHTTVDATHQAGVVIGDFNDLNVLVSNTEAYIIDADSCQWGPYLCKVYTNKFVDPILCNPTGMIKHHNENSDWYAFSVMLFQSLLFVDPYGGVYRPKNPKDKIPPSARQLKRITVFNPEVIYPKPAVPYWVLPDDLLNHFHRLFEQDVRGVFPVGILENMRWTQCNTCGLVHARDKCPQCNQAAPGTITKREVVKVDGKKIIFDRLFQTSGRILFATYQNGIKYLYQNDGETCFRREDGSIAVDNITDNPKMRFRINGKNTLVAMGHKMFLLSPNQTPESVMVDNFGSLPMFDANQNHRYWLTNGRLWRNGLLGNELVGESLENQTLFWVGDKFGFGFYQSGEMSMHFTFDSNRSGINDSV
jgi:H/ACA ribonucleoprotein complex subunit 3